MEVVDFSGTTTTLNKLLTQLYQKYTSCLILLLLEIKEIVDASHEEEISHYQLSFTCAVYIVTFVHLPTNDRFCCTLRIQSTLILPALYLTWIICDQIQALYVKANSYN